MVYKLEFEAAEVDLIGFGLMELPKKLADPVYQKLAAQVAAQKAAFEAQALTEEKQKRKAKGKPVAETEKSSGPAE